MLKSPPLMCEECERVASFATLDLKTKIVTYKCELCGDEYYDTNPDLEGESNV